MLGALRLLPQFRLLIGQQGCRGMGCRPIGLLRAIYVRESGELNVPSGIKFIHTTTLRVTKSPCTRDFCFGSQLFADVSAAIMLWA